MLDYGDDKYEIQFYTNNIMKYPGTEMFFGMPTRYINRHPDLEHFKYLPDWHGKRADLLAPEGARTGVGFTDAVLMTSRDGLKFDRINDVFYAPTIETRENWVYGDCFFALGFVETESDYAGEPNELSFYCGTGNVCRAVTMERFTIRKDGLLSWGAGFDGGNVLTKPFIFDGNKMTINFATSALGLVVVEFCDENGKPIPGYKTCRMFGNSLERPCDFEKPLSELSGKKVRMNITMRDADLYSFEFDK